MGSTMNYLITLYKTAFFSISFAALICFYAGNTGAADVNGTEQLPAMFPQSDQGLSYAEKSKRFYFSLRYGRAFVMESDIAPGLEIDQTTGQELLGTQIGYDLSERISLELVADGYEMNINAKGFGKTVEYANYMILPQIKLRHPMQNGRLNPYLIGGIGIAFTEANDRTPLGEGLPAIFGPPTGPNPAIPIFDGTDTSLVYSIGTGVEYFIADNVALGIEAKYLSQSADVTVNKLGHQADLDAFFISGGIRFLFPGPARASSAYSSMAASNWLHINSDTLAPYIGFRVGMGKLAEDQITPDFEFSDHEQEQVINLTLGMELNPYLAAEVAVDHFGNDVNASRANTAAKVAEMNIVSAVPQLRLQYPMLDDKLLPYVVGGVGLGFIQTNDRTSLGESNRVQLFSADNFSLVSVAGAGVDYYIANNMTIGIEAKYLFNSTDVDIDHIPVETDMDRMILTAGLRVFF